MYINVASNNSASNLSNKISNGEWVVLYYADWCGHCTTMKPEWHKFIKHMKTSRNNINVASVNSDFVGDLKHKPVIDGYPSITMYINNDYTGGELEYVWFNKTYRPQAGDIVIFPSNYIFSHKVHKILSGIRYAVVRFYKWKTLTDFPKMEGQAK